MLVASQLEDGVGRRAVEEMDLPSRPAAFDKKPSNPMPRDPDEIVFTAAEGKANQLNQALGAAGKMPTKSQKTLSMLAKSVETDRNWPAIRPEHLVPFEMNGAAL